MKIKRMGITEILRSIWLFSANTIKSSESFSKHPTQPMVELNSSLWHIIVTNVLPGNGVSIFLKQYGLCACKAMVLNVSFAQKWAWARNVWAHIVLHP